MVVTQATLQSLAIDPPEALTAPGSKRRYQVVGTYSDGGTQNLTSQVTWSSSDTGVIIANDNLGPNIIGQARVDVTEPFTAPLNGALTAGTAVGTGDQPFSSAVDPTGRFVYAANTSSDEISVYTIDQTTGTLTAGTPVSSGSGSDPFSVITTP